MKFAVIGPTYPYKGGISHFTTIFVNHLRKTNTVDFVSWKIQYPKFLYPVEQKDTNSKQEIKTKTAYLINFYNPFSWVSTAIHIRRGDPEKLIISWVTPVQAPIYIIISILVKIFTKTRIVFLCHNSLPHEPKFYDNFLTKLAFKFADEFIAHSEEDKKIIQKLSNNKPVVKAFHPIYDEFNKGIKWDINATKKELGLKKNVLLFFGYIRPYKGLEYLIKAMPGILINHPDTALLVVGEFWSKDKPKYESLVRKFKLENSVKFIDKYVPNEEVGKYFSISDIVVCPYISATQSGIVQMAYAFDKPVIATKVGGIPDVVEPALSGYLVNPKSSKGIVKAVDNFYERPIDHKSLASTKNKFSWAQYISLTILKRLQYEK
jgi:glycosyltransferase involved in cell wall biosynthesis